MQKILIVKLIENTATKKEVSGLLAIGIDCGSNDEVHIKRTIESTRNPNVVMAIITRNMNRKDIFELKPKLDQIRQEISNADSIEVGFIPIEGCENDCKSCIIHGLHEKLEKLTKNWDNNNLISGICPN